MRDIVRRPEAQRDILDAADYIAEQSSFNASDRFLAATEKAFKLLAAMPGIGTPRDYDNPSFAGLRMWPVPKFSKYLIFYLTIDEKVEIVRVLHGAQNIQEIFAPLQE
jgi:toxin ParE1/3/4